MSKMAFVYPGQGVQNPGMGLMEYAEDWSVSKAYLSRESIAATLLIVA